METFSALLALCWGNPPVSGGFPLHRPVSRSFGVFFDLRLNIRVSKQSRRRWFEKPSCSLWRHFNDGVPASLSVSAAGGYEWRCDLCVVCASSCAGECRAGWGISPGGLLWDYCPVALSINQVTATYFKVVLMEMLLCSEINWGYIDTSVEDCSNSSA